MKLIVSLAAQGDQGLLGKLFGRGATIGIALGAGLFAGTVWAHQQSPVLTPGMEFTIFGSGRLSCGSWLAAKGYQRVIFHEWLNGYMSAYTLWIEHGSGPIGEADGPGAWAWIDNYCQGNPLKDVAAAAEQLIYAIEAK